MDRQRVEAGSGRQRKYSKPTQGHSDEHGMCWENSLCWIYIISGNAYQYRLIRLRVIGNAAESGLNNTTTANSNFSK